jgi:hypothetical protein
LIQTPILIIDNYRRIYNQKGDFMGRRRDLIDAKKVMLVLDATTIAMLKEYCEKFGSSLSSGARILIQRGYEVEFITPKATVKTVKRIPQKKKPLPVVKEAVEPDTGRMAPFNANDPVRAMSLHWHKLLDEAAAKNPLNLSGD